MTDPEQSARTLIEVLKHEFAGPIDNGSLDVVVDGDNDVVEVQTDEWTLILEGQPIIRALIALDASTDNDEQHRQALEAAVKPHERALLAHADATLDGAITTGLNASGDGMSLVLAEMIASRA